MKHCSYYEDADGETDFQITIVLSASTDLYVFPRFSTLPGHEHKAFIPYTSIFKDAPRRPRSASRIRNPGTRADVRAEAQPQQATSNPCGLGSSEQMLGMGSVSGNTLKSKASTNSDASDDSGADRVSRFTRSASRSSSEGSLFERDDERRSAERSAATSSSSSVTSSSDRQSPKETNENAARLAGSRGLEEALPGEGQASRAEEKLGRPEIQVENLSAALDGGVNLDGVEPGTAEDEHDLNIPQGFEEASPHVVLQASVSSITPSHIIVQTSQDARSNGKGKLWSIDSASIPYTHLVYALGSHLPDPLRTEARTKPSGMSWMREMQDRVKVSREIVLVGGGALGVEFATDIKSIYPDKDVTLIHSRKQLLPNFDHQVHEAAHQRLTELGVNLVLGERLALTEGCPRGSTVRPEQQALPSSSALKTSAADVCPPLNKSGEGAQARNEGMCLGDGRKRVKTTGGREFECDLLLLCTGQQPNSSLMAQLSPTSVDPATRLIRVHPTLQVKVPDPHDSLAQMPFDARPPCGDCDCFLDKKAAGAAASSEADGDEALFHRDGRLPNVYAIGDVADAFGALNAGYQAWNMADVAAENIMRDIEAEQAGKAASEGQQQDVHVGPDGHADATALQEFQPPVNMLKLSLGLGKMVFQGAPSDENGGRPVVEVRDDAADLAVEGVWQFMAGMSTSDMYV